MPVDVPYLSIIYKVHDKVDRIDWRFMASVIKSSIRSSGILFETSGLPQLRLHFMTKFCHLKENSLENWNTLTFESCKRDWVSVVNWLSGETQPHVRSYRSMEIKKIKTFPPSKYWTYNHRVFSLSQLLAILNKFRWGSISFFPIVYPNCLGSSSGVADFLFLYINKKCWLLFNFCYETI